MLHHVSFSVHEPERAANLMSELMSGTPLKAPCPPFPVGSWFVVMGDAWGSLIELTPWGSVLDPNQKGFGSDMLMRPHSASHVLASTPLTTNEILNVAEQRRVEAMPADAGLFQLIKIWIEESLLLELLPPEHQSAYAACFGAPGADVLDHRLRGLEQALATRR